MLHRFAFADGAVTYANRFLASKAFTAAQETGKITYAEFATDPCRTLFGRVAAIFDPKLTDNCNVNVVGIRRRACRLHRDDNADAASTADTLETLGVLDYRAAAQRPGLDRASALRRGA